MDDPTPCGSAHVHVWGRDSILAFCKAAADLEARGVLRDARITSDDLTFGKPKHIQLRTTDESGQTLKPFNDIWTCPPWPPSVCEGG